MGYVVPDSFDVVDILALSLSGTADHDLTIFKGRGADCEVVIGGTHWRLSGRIIQILVDFTHRVVVQDQKDRISIQINLYVEQYLESSDLHARNAELELGGPRRVIYGDDLHLHF